MTNKNVVLEGMEGLTPEQISAKMLALATELKELKAVHKSVVSKPKTFDEVSQGFINFVNGKNKKDESKQILAMFKVDDTTLGDNQIKGIVANVVYKDGHTEQKTFYYVWGGNGLRTWKNR